MIFRVGESSTGNSNSERGTPLPFSRERHHALTFSGSNGLVPTGRCGKRKREQRDSPMCSHREVSAVQRPEKRKRLGKEGTTPIGLSGRELVKMG